MQQADEQRARAGVELRPASDTTAVLADDEGGTIKLALRRVQVGNACTATATALHCNCGGRCMPWMHGDGARGLGTSHHSTPWPCP